MKGNILGIFFTIFSGALIALIIIAYGRSDRVGPEFRFSALNLIYDSETKESDLIDGINAYDSRDGDMTSRIVVEKVVLNRDAETAVVYYAVADFSGNVTKQSRVFAADIEDIDKDGEQSGLVEEESEFFPQLSFGDGDSPDSSAGGEDGSGSDEEGATESEEQQ